MVRTLAAIARDVGSNDTSASHVIFDDEITQTNEPRKVRNYRRARWPQFKEYITDSIPDLDTIEIHTPQQLEDAVINLTEIIQNELTGAFQKRKSEFRIKSCQNLFAT